MKCFILLCCFLNVFVWPSQVLCAPPPSSTSAQFSSLSDTTGFSNQLWSFQKQPPSIQQHQTNQAIKDSDFLLHTYYQAENKKKPSLLGVLVKTLYSRATSKGLAEGVDYSDFLSKTLNNLELCSRRDPSNLAVRTSMGILESYRGNRRTALAHFRKAVFLLSWLKQTGVEAPRNLEMTVFSELAWSCRELALWDEAQVAFELGLAIDKGNPSLLLVKGLVLAGSGHGAEAMSYAIRMPPLNYHHVSSNSMGYRRTPNNFANRWIKSQVLLSEGNFTGAVHVLGDLEAEKTHRLPFVHQFWTDVGLIFELAGDRRATGMYSEWNNYFLPFISSKVGTLKPIVLDYPHQNIPFITSNNRFYLAGSPFGYLADQMNRMSNDSLIFGKEELRLRALDLLRVLEAKGAPAGLCSAFRGRVLMLGGTTSEAGPELRAAHTAFAAAGKLDVGTNLLLGLVEMLDGNSIEAETLFRDALVEDPNQTSGWKNLAIACDRSGQSELALNAIDRALDLDPDSAAAWYNRGVINFHQEKWDAALADLEKAWHLDPNDQRISLLLQKVASAKRGK